MLSMASKSNQSKAKNSPSPTKRKTNTPAVFDYEAPKRTPDRATKRKLQSTTRSRVGSISSNQIINTTPAKRAVTRRP